MNTALELRWQRGTVKTEAWRLLHPVPATNLGFSEVDTYLIEKPGGDCSLYVDDERLEDSPADVSCWVWKPKFFAGEVTAELVFAGQSASTLYLLDVAPDSNKLGREHFAQMVRELWQEDPQLVIGDEPATATSGELGTGEDRWTAFARLRRYGVEAIQALAKIRERPLRKLRARRDSVALHQVRRVDRYTATSLVRSAPIGLFDSESNGTSPVATATRLNVPCEESTLDSAANRAMLALVFALLRRTRSLKSELESLVEASKLSETRTSLESRWPKRKQFLIDLEGQLVALVRQEPFSKAERKEITSAGLTAIAADPTYSGAWRLGRKALREGVDSETSAERRWISPSWEIYEKWCFLSIGKQLAQEFPEWRWARKRSRPQWEGSSNGVEAVLFLQPQFGANRKGEGKMWSISKQREPDLVLQVEDNGEVRYVVLDAKYRATRANVLDAMESAHIYQDSLRIGARRPEGSLLIVPAAGGASWLECPEFQEEHRVGVHVMAPGQDKRLPLLIARILKNAAEGALSRSV